MAIPREKIIMFVIAAVFGIVAIVMVRSYIQKTNEEYKSKLEEETMAKIYGGADIEVVFTASKDIPQDTVIAQDMLEQTKVPRRFIQPYAVGAAQNAVGKYTIAPIAKGEQILVTKLVASAEEAKKKYASMSIKTPAGKRALTLEMDRLSGAGGFVNPGDYIDILWTFFFQKDKERQPITVTLMQNLLVLEVGYGEKEQKERPANFPVTLALTPQEASALLFAKENGKLQLILRPKSDVEIGAVAPMSMDSLLSQILPQAVKETKKEDETAKVTQQILPKEKPVRTLEIYRGLEKEIITLSGSEDGK